MEKIPATVTVLTRNSGKTLERALASVRDFDEIIVCDGGSTDETLEIAHKHGARVIAQDGQFHDAKGKIYDYAGVRNQTLHAARHNWISGNHSACKWGLQRSAHNFSADVT